MQKSFLISQNLLGLNIFIQISIYIVIYKYTFNKTIMMGFRKSQMTYTNPFPFEIMVHNLELYKSSENYKKNTCVIFKPNNLSTLNVNICKVLHAI